MTLRHILYSSGVYLPGITTDSGFEINGVKYTVGYDGGNPFPTTYDPNLKTYFSVTTPDTENEYKNIGHVRIYNPEVFIEGSEHNWDAVHRVLFSVYLQYSKELPKITNQPVTQSLEEPNEAPTEFRQAA